MKITISPRAYTVPCRACIGGVVLVGDQYETVLVGDQYETCSVCNGTCRHPADATYGVADEDGVHLQHDGGDAARGPHGLAVLVGMNRLSHVYAGTVPAATVQRRRTKNRAARAARRVTRRAAR